MSNNIKEDLCFFNKLINELIDDELANPVSKTIPPKDLHSTFDIELRKTAATGKDFKKSLKKIILSTPKSSSKRFFNQLFGGNGWRICF